MSKRKYMYKFHERRNKGHNIPQWLDKRNIPKSLNIAGQNNMKESLSLRPLTKRIGASRPVATTSLHLRFNCPSNLVAALIHKQSSKLIVRCTFPSLYLSALSSLVRP